MQKLWLRQEPDIRLLLKVFRCCRMFVSFVCF